jgi:hypothetical protein
VPNTPVRTDAPVASCLASSDPSPTDSHPRRETDA